jgi:hypothetical protein
MTISVRPGLILAIILMASSIPFVIDASTSWLFLKDVPKEVIGFSDMLLCIGIGMLVEWLFFRDYYDGGGGM